AELGPLVDDARLVGRTAGYERFGRLERVGHRVAFVANAARRRVGASYPWSLTYDEAGGAAAVRAYAHDVAADVVILPSFLLHYATGLQSDGRRVIADVVDVQEVHARTLMRTYGRRQPWRLPGLLANYLAARSQERLLLP